MEGRQGEIGKLGGEGEIWRGGREIEREREGEIWRGGDAGEQSNSC